MNYPDGITHPPFAVSVIIPLCNKVDQIRATMKSAITQNVSADEIIVIDDGSTDDSAENISDLLGASVRLLRQDNQGPGAARNRGASAARSDWLAFLDADDLWRPDHLVNLARLHAAFPQAGVLVSNHDRATHGEFIDIKGPELPNDTGRILDFMNDPACLARVNSSAIAIKRSIFEAHGGFACFCPGEDTDFWFRLALDTVFAISDYPTVVIVRGTGGIMDQWDSRQSLGLPLPELFATIDRAIAQAPTSYDAQSMKNYRSALLRRSIIQALYRGETVVARTLFKRMGEGTQPRDVLLELLIRLPASALQWIVRMRSRFRKSAKKR